MNHILWFSGGARDSPAPVNLSAPHKGAQAGFSYPMMGTTSLYPSYAHPSMVGRTAAVTGSTATYSPPAASPAPVPAVMPLGPPSAPPRRRATVTMSTASTINLPPPSAPPPTSAYAPTPTSAPSLPAPSAPTPVSAAAPTPAPAPSHNDTQVVPPAVTKDLACFKRGARIRLASGEVRAVESMRAEDLVTSADPSLQTYAATVVKLTQKPGGTVAVAMSLQQTGENGAQFEVKFHFILTFRCRFSTKNLDFLAFFLSLTKKGLYVYVAVRPLLNLNRTSPNRSGTVQKYEYFSFRLIYQYLKFAGCPHSRQEFLLFIICSIFDRFAFCRVEIVCLSRPILSFQYPPSRK